MTLIVPAATAAATTATLWFIPILVAAVSFYQYDKTDPEGRPKDTKVNKKPLRLFNLDSTGTVPIEKWQTGI